MAPAGGGRGLGGAPRAMGGARGGAAPGARPGLWNRALGRAGRGPAAGGFRRLGAHDGQPGRLLLGGAPSWGRGAALLACGALLYLLLLAQAAMAGSRGAHVRPFSRIRPRRPHSRLTPTPPAPCPAAAFLFGLLTKREPVVSSWPGRPVTTWWRGSPASL